jgi:hypothetical protein
MVLSDADFNQAETRMEELRRAGHVVAVRYDAVSGRVIIDLNTGVQFAIPPALVEGLSGASEKDLSEVEISPTGLGLHWPRLDADVYVPALLQGVFGSPSWMAAQLGASGGQVKSDAKAEAARRNGQKGGRPRKAAGGS